MPATGGVGTGPAIQRATPIGRRGVVERSPTVGFVGQTRTDTMVMVWNIIGDGTVRRCWL